MKKTVPQHRRVYIITAVIFAALIAAVVLYLQVLRTHNVSEPVTNVCIEYDAEVGRQCIREYLELSEEDALNKATGNGLLPQVVRVDDEDRGMLDIAGPVIYFETRNGTVVDGYFDWHTKDGRQE